MGSVQTVALSGFDRDDESKLRAWFDQVNTELGSPFALVKDPGADVLIIDIDSIYGQMDWLRTQGTDRIVVVHTSGTGADARYRLPRPLQIEDIREVLGALRGNSPPIAPQVDVAVRPAPKTEPKPVAPAAAAPVAPPVTAAAPVVETKPDKVEPQRSEPAVQPAPSATPSDAPTLSPTPEPEVAEGPILLVDFLRGGALGGPVAYAMDDGQRLVLDPSSETYFGVNALKPLLQVLTRTVTEDDLVRLEGVQWERLLQADPTRHPWSRLLWLAALHAGQGSVIGFGPEQIFKLNRWPQIEREFPRHFRIATALMRQAGTVEAIAAQSGAPGSEVADLINAYLLTGHIEAENVDAQRLSGVRLALWGRLRRVAQQSV